MLTKQGYKTKCYCLMPEVAPMGNQRGGVGAFLGMFVDLLTCLLVYEVLCITICILIVGVIRVGCLYLL